MSFKLSKTFNNGLNTIDNAFEALNTGVSVINKSLQVADVYMDGVLIKQQLRQDEELVMDMLEIQADQAERYEKLKTQLSKLDSTDVANLDKLKAETMAKITALRK